MFELVSNYKPTGDQPEAIEYLAKRNKKSARNSRPYLELPAHGKTFTMANVIEKVQKPTLVLAHNKTLARTII